MVVAVEVGNFVRWIKKKRVATREISNPSNDERVISFDVTEPSETIRESLMIIKARNVTNRHY